MAKFTLTVETDDPDRIMAEIERALEVWLHKPVTVRRLYPSGTREVTNG